MGGSGGRPKQPGHRPTCPDGHDGRIHFHGFRRRNDRLYARPRYECLHSVHNASCRTGCQQPGPHTHGKRACQKPCDGTHTFTGPEQARTHAHPEGLWCRECDRDRSERDGTPVGNEWDFEARLIADALMSVGSGASFRQAAEQMRMTARRFQRDGQGIAYASRAGETIARYLDHFGQLVLAEIEHEEWPEVLVLDAMPFRRREVVEGDPFSFEQSGNGAVLVALGYTDPLPRRRRRRRDDEDFDPTKPVRPKRRPHLWRMKVAGGYDRWSWFDFLSDLGGTPKWIVVDGDAAVRHAIRLRWGSGPGAPIVFSCEGHLQRKFQERARDQDKLPGIALWRLWPKNKRGSANPLPGPLWSRDDYRRFLDEVLKIPEDKRANITNWILNHHETILRQFELREQNPGMPRGTGAVEAAIITVGGWFGDRKQQFQNTRRLDIVLGLMRAQIAGHADAALYSRVVRGELERTNGRLRLNWRQHHNPWSARKALFALSNKAQARIDAEQAAYLVSAQSSTVGRKAAAMNLYHLTNGYDPIELTTSPTVSVKTAGKLVSDFPLIAREWDPANPGAPDTTPATSKQKVGWICAIDPTHRWDAQVIVRTGRLTGCGAKRGGAAAQHNSDQPSLRRLRLELGPLENAPAIEGEMADEERGESEPGALGASA